MEKRHTDWVLFQPPEVEFRRFFAACLREDHKNGNPPGTAFREYKAMLDGQRDIAEMMIAEYKSKIAEAEQQIAAPNAQKAAFRSRREAVDARMRVLDQQQHDVALTANLHIDIARETLVLLQEKRKIEEDEAAYYEHEREHLEAYKFFVWYLEYTPPPAALTKPPAPKTIF